MMTIYVADEGSKYIVKDENLADAYRWLKAEGEFALKIGHVDGCTWLGANGENEMFCGEIGTCFQYAECAADFMADFCEDGSYACFRDVEHELYTLVWRQAGEVWIERKGYVNPFAEKIDALHAGLYGKAAEAGFKCPNCCAETSIGATSLDGWDDELSSGYVFVDVTCGECKTEYTNVYRFDHSETTHEED